MREIAKILSSALVDLLVDSTTSDEAIQIGCSRLPVSSNTPYCLCFRLVVLVLSSCEQRRDEDRMISYRQISKNNKLVFLIRERVEYPHPPLALSSPRFNRRMRDLELGLWKACRTLL
jgi:hypothetical protein